MAAADWSIMVEWTRHALINWLLCLKLDKSILSAFYVNMTFENRIESCVLLSEGLNGHLFPLISMFWSHEVHVIILYCLKISFILSFLGFVNNKITWQFDSPLTPHLLSSGVGGKHLYHEGVKFKAQAIQVLNLSLVLKYFWLWWLLLNTSASVQAIELRWDRLAATTRNPYSI